MSHLQIKRTHANKKFETMRAHDVIICCAAWVLHRSGYEITLPCHCHMWSTRITRFIFIVRPFWSLNIFKIQIILMFCSECATKVVENALFCHHCGAQAAQSSKSDPSHASTSSGVKNTKNSINTGGPKALSAGSGPPIMTFHEFRGRKEPKRRRFHQQIWL